MGKSLIRTLLVAILLAILTIFERGDSLAVEQPNKLYNSSKGEKTMISGGKEGKQSLNFGEVKLEKMNRMSTLYYLSGKRMYEIGAMSGDYPQIGWHIPGEMGGIWAHPIKVLDGFYFEIEDGVEDWRLTDCQNFSFSFAYADFHFEKNGLKVERRDFVVEDKPALFSLVSIQNEGKSSRDIKLRFIGEVDIMPSWYSSFGGGKDILEYRDGKIIAYDRARKERWGAAFGANLIPEGQKIEGHTGILEYSLSLGPKEKKEIKFLIVAEHEEGYKKALSEFNSLMVKEEQLFAEKVNYYKGKILGGVKFDCSDPSLVKAYQCAKANLTMLTTDISPYLGKYLFAGLPEYVQLFGCDTTYSIPGLVSINFNSTAKDALECLANIGKKQGGKIPHEVTTSGGVYHWGNTQETPQFVIACWDYFSWAGAEEFLKKMYPLCKEGVFDYILKFFDVDKDLYPEGNGMVERGGMGPEKLDSTCYLYKAILNLSWMAKALGKEEELIKFKDMARDIKKRFNKDWWLEEESLFADSLEEDNSPRLDGHWTVAVPMEVGIADEEKGRRALKRIEREWVNPWGMIHTRGMDDRVWTLPTGVLAKAEFNYGNVEMGLRLIKDIAQTINYGLLGSYEELIPHGLCFMQLWSSALFLQGITEGVFGLNPPGSKDYIEVFPKLPEDWEYTRIEDVKMAGHQISLLHERLKENKARLSIAHTSGERDLKCKVSLFVCGEPSLSIGKEKLSNYKMTKKGERNALTFDILIKPGQTVEIIL
jgi:hypothetical protein